MIVLVVIMAIASVAVYGFVFGLSGCFGGYGCSISITTSCTIQNRTCAVTISEKDNVGLVASSCQFGNGVPGTMSDRPGGPSVQMPLQPGSSVTVYCSGYQGTPEAGAIINGTIGFSPPWQTQFSGVWH